MSSIFWPEQAQRHAPATQSETEGLAATQVRAAALNCGWMNDTDFRNQNVGGRMFHRLRLSVLRIMANSDLLALCEFCPLAREDLSNRLPAGYEVAGCGSRAVVWCRAQHVRIWG